MLKRLRINFIALNMVIAALVLIVAFGAICYIDYRSSVDEVYSALNMTLERARLLTSGNAPEARSGNAAVDDADGMGVDDGNTGGMGADNANAPDESDNRPETNGGGQYNPPQIGNRPDSDNSPSIPIAVYLVTAEGSYSLINTYTTAAISDDVLDQATQLAYDNEDSSGYLQDLGLYFSKEPQPNTMEQADIIAYADAANTSSWKNLALTLTGVGVAALIALLLINIFFARWALRPVERAWKQQQQFVADASHELKTPLTVILANTAILKAHENATIADQIQWVESTETEAGQMQELVNDMLELARPEDEHEPEAAFVDVDLADLVEGEVLQFESVAYEHNIELSGSTDVGIQVRGDPKRLARLISTLIDNACKYAGENGHVDIILQSEAREAVLIVRNDGTYIAREDLEHVFDRFYRADKSRADDTGGFGLGLAIAREVAREHGGDITVRSSPEEGTEFVAKFPLQRQ